MEAAAARRLTIGHWQYASTSTFIGGGKRTNFTAKANLQLTSWISVRPYSTESISCTTRSVVESNLSRTSGLAVPVCPPLPLPSLRPYLSKALYQCNETIECKISIYVMTPKHIHLQ